MEAKLKRAAAIVSLGLAAVIGIGLMIYPAVGNYFDEITQSKAEAVYTEKIENTAHDALEAAFEAARQYNLQLVNEAVTQETAAYEDQLNLQGNGVMGYLSIPCIGVSLPIYHGVADDTMTQGAGHLPTSSLPVGGESTHCILSAHSGVASKKLFTDLEKMLEGDLFSIRVCGKTLTYQVDQILVTLPEDIRCLDIVEGADYVTLLTCTPYGVNTHRLLVRGVRIELPEDEGVEPTLPPEETPRMSAWMMHYIKGIVIALLAAAVCVAIAWIAVRRKRHA